MVLWCAIVGGCAEAAIHLTVHMHVYIYTLAVESATSIDSKGVVAAKLEFVFGTACLLAGHLVWCLPVLYAIITK